jgi:hypothetical protein
MNKVTDALAAVTVGIFASTLFAVAIAVAPSMHVLDATQYTLVKQGQIRVLQVAMTAISLVYTVAAVLVLVRERHAKGPAFRLTLVALGLVIAALIYSAPTDIAYNRQILSWNPATPPADWASVRDAWDFSNQLRSVPSLVAFALQVMVCGCTPASGK